MWKYCRLDEKNLPEKFTESQKQLLENEKKDLSIPNSLGRGIGFSFIAVLIGIVMPAMYQYYEFEKIGSSLMALVGFLLSLVVMFYYFVYEFNKEVLGSMEKQVVNNLRSLADI